MRDPGLAQLLLDEVRDEMDRQDEKWPWPRPAHFLVDDRQLLRMFRTCEIISRKLFSRGLPCWMAIMGEEIGEVATADAALRREELVQVAAVCLSWAQAIEEESR